MINISVIIPTFNEEKVIKECLDSLDLQSSKDFEVILIDDGSNDKTLEILSEIKIKNYELRVLKQGHKGPGIARNRGAKEAKGKVLVFVDADMTFEKKFIENLVKPIISGEIKGTFSKEEFLQNKDNIWSKCWNINKNLPIDRMHTANYPDEQPVFRAILKNEFERVGGFDAIGYVDDHTLFEKLGYKAKNAPSAIFYHKNPESIVEVFNQARWVGKSEFKRRKIKNEELMRFFSIIRYSIPVSIVKGFIGFLRYGIPEFIIFKIIFDYAVEVSLFGSFFNNQKYK